MDRPSHRRLLSILSLDANRRVGSEVLIDRFWGEKPPATARAALQTHVAALRKLLGEGAIVTEGYGYRLGVDQDAFDAATFHRLAREATRHLTNRDWDLARANAETALDLWRGEPYSELIDDEFAMPQRARLEETYLELLELRAEAMLALGREAELLADLEALVVEHPLRERLWEHLITARYRMGRNADALHAYQEVAAHLGEIGLEPGEALRRLEEKILLHDETLTRTKTNLPVELDRFIGREDELQAIVEMLGQHRLVTLVGPAGTGKTRLAVTAARQLLGTFTDGIWFVELAPIRDAQLIDDELAVAIGLAPSTDPRGMIHRALAADTTLIVLDNCEHVLAGAEEVVRSILESCPNVRVLATSREPLRVPGGSVFEVPGMGVPDEGSPVSDVSDYDAIELFVDRATRARSSLGFDEGDLARVGEICGRLDGLPLAIELAAARTATLSPDVIIDRLDDRFSLLNLGSTTVPDRHRTLEATIEWSYQLLGDLERAVLMRLGVFRGGFQLDMAEHVCEYDGVEVISIVSDLISKSLVSQYESPTGRRYRLLETIRDFALVRLDASADATAARDRHLSWCVEFASDICSELMAGHRDGPMERLQVEAENLQEALGWAEQQGRSVERGRLQETLSRYWISLGRAQDASRALEEALAPSTGRKRETHLRTLLSQARFWNGDVNGAMREASAAYELAKEIPSSIEKIFAIAQLANQHMLEVSEDPGKALELAEEALEVALDLGDPFSESVARRQLATALSWNGRTQEGIAQARAVLEMAKRGDERTQLFTSFQLLLHVLYMDRKARRDGPAGVVEEMLEEFPVDDPRWRPQLTRGWTPWTFIQTGRLRLVADLMDEVDSGHLQSWALVEHRLLRGCARWMLGDLVGARADLRDAEREGVNPRWYHDYYPLLVDVLCDLGLIDEAAEAAEVYLETQVHPSEEIKKVGVLDPLVRAEIDRAVAVPDGRSEREAQARTLIETMERTTKEFPQPIEGSISMETPGTHLAMARAELSRLTGPDPNAWQEAHELADFLYFRLYAQLRLGEALLQAGHVDEGTKQLDDARAAITGIGADRLLSLVDQIAEEF